MRIKHLIISILLLFPLLLSSQSEGGFGVRRFANTAAMTATSVNNSDKSASRIAYVHSTGLYYIWNGSAWEIEQKIDTLLYSNDTLRISIIRDGLPQTKVRIQGGDDIIDTVSTVAELRLYSEDAPLVFVKNEPQKGLFLRQTGSVTEDYGIYIDGTYNWIRVSPDLTKVNVKWFGAVGDSTTDDNTAIQRARDYVNSHPNTTLFFPSGKYRYTQTISFYKPVNIGIEGDGMYSTYLFPVNVTGIRIRTDSTTTVVDPTYGVKEGRDLLLAGFSMIRVGPNDFNGKIQGIDLRGGFNKQLYNIKVEEFFGEGGTGAGSIGIRLWPTLTGDDAVQHTVFENVWVTECDTGIVMRLHNVVTFRNLSLDQNKAVGLATSNGFYWTGGLCQGNENTGIWLRNSDPFILSEVIIKGVHFESNAYVTPKWGGIYKGDETNMTSLTIQYCSLSGSGDSHLFRIKKVIYACITQNKYFGNATTDTVSLSSVYNGIIGNDNYTSLKLITSDVYCRWENGEFGTTEQLVGTTIGTSDPGVNMLGVGGGIGIGSTYYDIVAPTNGAIFEGNVGIKVSSPTQTFDVDGNARFRDAIYDGNNESGSSGQVLASTVTGIDWVTLYTPTGLGTSNQILGMNNAGNAFEWKTYLGTVNQVTITDGVGTKTWSLPQDIHTAATPTFSDLTLTDDLFVTDDVTIGTSNSISSITMSATSLNSLALGTTAYINIGSTSAQLNMNGTSGTLNVNVDNGGVHEIKTARNTSGTTPTTDGVRVDYVQNDGAALEAGHFISVERFQSRGDAATVRSGAQIIVSADQTWTNTSAPADIRFYTVPVGNTVLQERLVINSGGELDLLSGNTFRLFDSNNSNHYRIKAPANDSLTSNLTWILPRTTGTNGQVLKIRSDSLLYWANDNSGGGGNGIYGGDGTVPDDTYARIDSTFLFALGEFPNFPDFSWGRGFYYDPGDGGNPTRDVRIHNKRNDNTAYSYLRMGEQNTELGSLSTTASSLYKTFSSSESAFNELYAERPNSSYGKSALNVYENANESGLTLTQNGEGTLPTVSVYLGDGYSSSQYNKYADRAFGVQSVLTNGFDWFQILLPDSATDTTGNNINFYNRKYFWSNEMPDVTNADTSVHVWIGNGTTTTPDFVDLVDFFDAHAQNIYNSNGTTDDNTRTVNILQTLKFVGSADAGVDPFPFQVISTGNEPLIQLWKGNTDSVWIKQSDVEYLFGSSTHLVVESTDKISVTADSILLSTVESKTKIRNLLGLAATGYTKQLDGNAAGSGETVMSNGTDWVVTNTQATLRPSQLTTTTNNWNPTGFTTYSHQNIIFSGDGDFECVTGLTAATRDGVTKTFKNNGTNCVVFAKQHTSSSAGNRFDVFQDVVFYPGLECTFRYDSVGADWELQSSNKEFVLYPQAIEYTQRDVGASSGDDWWIDFNAFGGTYNKTTASASQNLRVNRLITGSVATSYPSLTTWTGQVYQTINRSYYRIYSRVRVEDLSTAAEDFDVRIGFSSAIDTNETEGAYIVYKREVNSGGFHIYTHNGSTSTNTNAGSPIAADTYYEVELIYYPYGEVTAFIDGVRYTTTSTLPDGTIGLLVYQIDKDNGTTSRELLWTELQAHWVYVSE